MLDRRDDVLALDAADRFARERAGEQRVLAEIFEVAAVARIAREIDPAREHHVESLAARLRSDHDAAAVSELGAPSCRERERRRQRRRAVPGASALRIRDAEPRVA